MGVKDDNDDEEDEVRIEFNRCKDNTVEEREGEDDEKESKEG